MPSIDVTSADPRSRDDLLSLMRPIGAPAVSLPLEEVGAARFLDAAVIIMDVPSLDDAVIATIPAIKSGAPPIAIIIATESTDLRHAIAALRARVADDLVKPVRPVDLRAALDRAHARLHAPMTTQTAMRSLMRAADEWERLQPPPRGTPPRRPHAAAPRAADGMSLPNGVGIDRVRSALASPAPPRHAADEGGMRPPVRPGPT